MSSTYIEEMNVILSKKRESGEGGVRLFARDGRDVSAEDIAHDFIKIQQARETGRLKLEKVSSVEF